LISINLSHHPQALLSAANKELKQTKEDRDAKESRIGALEEMHQLSFSEVLKGKEELNSKMRKMQREMDEMKKQLPENEDGEAQSAESEVENLKV